MKDVYNIFRPITEEVGKLLNMQIYYTYGSWDEIVVELSEMAKDPSLCQDRYPLIALVGDVQVNHSDPTIFGEGTFNLLIATLTQQTLTPSERIELSFKPILWPIHETLINQFLYSLASFYYGVNVFIIFFFVIMRKSYRIAKPL